MFWAMTSLFIIFEKLLPPFWRLDQSRRQQGGCVKQTPASVTIILNIQTTGHKPTAHDFLAAWLILALPLLSAI